MNYSKKYPEFKIGSYVKCINDGQPPKSTERYYCGNIYQITHGSFSDDTMGIAPLKNTAYCRDFVIYRQVIEKSTIGKGSNPYYRIEEPFCEPNRWIITKFTGIINSSGFINSPYITNMNSNNIEFRSSSAPSYHERHVYQATTEEIEWLDTCIKANCLVERPT